jgi:hypothetical protein
MENILEQQATLAEIYASINKLETTEMKN